MKCIGIFLVIIFVTLKGIQITESHVPFELSKLKNHRIQAVKRPPSLSKRPFDGIKGGDLATKGQFTYVVSLQDGGTNICGGSIIKNKFIVTAAHCVINEIGEFLSDELTVLTNVIDLYEDTISENIIKVEKVYAPKEFKPQEITNYATERVLADIAVIKLAEAVGSKIDSFSMKLKLPEKSGESYEDVNATIVGYGWDTVRTYTERISKKKYESGQSSGRLRHAIAQVLSNDNCSEVMSVIRDSNLCAQVRQRQKDDGEGVCAGDSGGPLVYDGTLIGVLSTSPFGCEETVGSGVYTRVSSYLDFIKAAIDDKVTEDIRTKNYKSD